VDSTPFDSTATPPTPQLLLRAPRNHHPHDHGSVPPAPEPAGRLVRQVQGHPAGGGAQRAGAHSRSLPAARAHILSAIRGAEATSVSARWTERPLPAPHRVQDSLYEDRPPVTPDRRFAGCEIRPSPSSVEPVATSSLQAVDADSPYYFSSDSSSSDEDEDEAARYMYPRIKSPAALQSLLATLHAAVDEAVSSDDASARLTSALSSPPDDGRPSPPDDDGRCKDTEEPIEHEQQVRGLQRTGKTLGARGWEVSSAVDEQQAQRAEEDEAEAEEELQKLVLREESARLMAELKKKQELQNQKKQIEKQVSALPPHFLS
jgi:hypothetical protein